MSESEPPLSILRVIEFIVCVVILGMLAASWFWWLLGRAWFGS